MSARLLPPERPHIARLVAETWAREHGVVGGAYLVGRRGYYRDTMGAPGANDIGLYDDAICLVTPNGFTAYNANTDPSKHRPGIATLSSGRWLYKVGIHGITRPKHRQYEALVQAAPVTVLRHEREPTTGWYGINIHRGGVYTTGSEGCQTIHPEQWPQFMDDVRAALAETGQRTIPYVLSVRPDA